jgi:phosphatidylglycerophosphatase A
MQSSFKKFQGFRLQVVFWLATGFGSGLFPRAPGTAGSVVGIGIAYLVRNWALGLRFFFWSLFILVGVWSAHFFGKTLQVGDHQSIVIDEVVGVAIASWTAGESAWLWILAFLLFRFFDILKLPPVGWIDRHSKDLHNSKDCFWGLGWSVVGDDLVAGLQALAILLFLQVFFVA